MKFKFKSLFFLIMTIWSCTPIEEAPVNLNFPQRIKAKTFSLHTPLGWELIEDQGYDTYVGRIKNNAFTLYFDQGYLSFGNLDNIQKNSETLYFQRLEINGASAIIHKEERADDPSYGTRLSVYIDSGEKQNRLYVLDPEDDAFFIELFKTHKFLD